MPLALVRRPLFLLIVALPLSSHAIEEPDYEVIGKIDTVEFRQYAACVVAEVGLNATANDAGNQAFPILAGYIFGKNKGERKYAMTDPVTQSLVTGGVRAQFVLPKHVALDSAPEPLVSRVQLRLVPASQQAVIRNSGAWSQANCDEHLALLQATLGKAGSPPRENRCWRATPRGSRPASCAATRSGWRCADRRRGVLLPGLGGAGLDAEGQVGRAPRQRGSAHGQQSDPQRPGHADVCAGQDQQAQANEEAQEPVVTADIGTKDVHGLIPVWL